jgi:hypothetical protein
MVTEALLAGILALGAGAAVALLRRQRARRSVVKLRSERHDVMVIAVHDWLDQPDIVRALLAEGVVRPEALVAFREVLGRMTEQRFFAAVGAMLDRRPVRQAISRHVARKGGDHRKVMAELYRIVQEAKGEAA